jgi:hypothetical protein
MNFVVLAVGWLVVAIGLFGMSSPHSMMEMILGWSSSARFYFAIIPRIVLGVLFILAAPRCRIPWLIYAIGIITLIAGVVLFFLGTDRVEDIVRWIAARSDLCIRLSYVVATLLGVLLVYVGSKRR